MSFESEKRKMEIKTNVREWIKSLGIALLASIFITTFVFNSAVVKGNSMYPTLEENDRLIVKKYEAVLKTEEYKRGDVIVFESPLENEDKYFIKRVIGLPGDKINISDGKLYINEKMIEEPYIDENSFTEALIYGTNYVVAENELFVMGDNRHPGKSNDSRSFGGISLEKVEGKIVFRLLPLNKIESDL